MSLLTLDLHDRLSAFLVELGESSTARPFHLIREDDITGQSGIGVVAEGLAWPNGATLMRWLSETPTITAFNHWRDIEAVHGHDGRTYIEWLTPTPTPQPQRETAYAPHRPAFAPRFA